MQLETPRATRDEENTPHAAIFSNEFPRLPPITTATPPKIFFDALHPESKLEAVGMKRIRTTEPDLSSSGYMVTEVDFGSPPPVILNFRDSVSKQGGHGSTQPGLAGMEDDKLTIEADDFIVSEGEKGPSIKFYEHVKERLYRPWRTSIIIKLMAN
ncbi:unnamed protein product [Prunus brigantina]